MTKSVQMRAFTGQLRLVVVSAMAWGAALGVGAAQTTTRVSTDATGTQVAGASRQPSASADGRFVAFSSTATALVAGDTNGSADIFVKDRQTGAVTRVSVRTGGAEAAGDSVAPDISADGRFVTFVSAAALTVDDTNSVSDVFRHDRTTGDTIRVSVATSGTQATAASARRGSAATAATWCSNRSRPTSWPATPTSGATSSSMTSRRRPRLG